MMVASCGLGIRFSQLLVHLVGGGLIDIVEKGMGLFGHYFSGVVDLVVFSCHAATSKASSGADDVVSWASFCFSDLTGDVQPVFCITRQLVRLDLTETVWADLVWSSSTPCRILLLNDDVFSTSLPSTSSSSDRRLSSVASTPFSLLRWCLRDPEGPLNFAHGAPPARVGGSRR
jgi:hypothetical protein